MARSPSKIALVVPQLLALLLVGVWLPIAALSGMAFDTPQAAKSVGVWLIVIPIWAYPLVVVGSCLTAWFFYSKHSYDRALIASYAPLIYGGAVFVLLFIAPPAAIKLTESLVRFFPSEAGELFKTRCMSAGEHLMKRPKEEIQGLYFARGGGHGYSRIKDGVFAAGTPWSILPLVDSGWLLFVEEPNAYAPQDEGERAKYRRHYFRDIREKWPHKSKQQIALR